MVEVEITGENPEVFPSPRQNGCLDCLLSVQEREDVDQKTVGQRADPVQTLAALIFQQISKIATLHSIKNGFLFYIETSIKEKKNPSRFHQFKGDCNL